MVMRTAQTTSDRRVEPSNARGEVAAAERYEVRLRFGAPAEVARYVRALTSLLFGASTRVTATLTTGARRDDLSAEEIADRIGRAAIEKLRFALRFGEHPLHIELAVPTSEPGTVVVRAPFTRGPAGSRLWLQSDVDVVAPIPVLALPATAEGLAIDAAHAIIGLGIRSGGFKEGELAGEHPLTWSTTKLKDAALPVRSVLRDAVWSTGTEAEGAAALWVTGLVQPPKSHAPEAGWWEQYHVLMRRPREALHELEAHLAAQFEIPFPWALTDIAAAREGTFAVPPEATTVARILPEAEQVVVAVDFDQPSAVASDILLHLCAHLVLGHVRPGDAWGHWDNAASCSPTPHRQWDREARAYIDANLTRPARRVSSLQECTPLEKAQLGLWRMIGEMLGESRRLHPSAESYQPAAYQRQAAQRLVSMLEEFGGAMLCDGVGLGKTYVATTTMVHFANAWRDRWAATPERLVEDPFRITVIAPYAVVSTWKREALPGLASFGVPLACVRVLSHTQLSRIVRTSELLEPVRGGVCDLEHLLLSDLVIVDEAHNFRSLAARRTKVLRDLLRVQPRREQRRRVLLLTATPINNSLDDLRQEVSLLYSRPLWLSEAKTDDGYRRQATKEIHDRCVRAQAPRSKGDVAPLVIHGDADAKFSDTIEFRDDLDFGPNVQRIGDYLKEQDKRLQELQNEIRAAAQSGPRQQERAHVRIAEDLLDRIVVQRSRALCKEIEKQQSSTVELLFRPDAAAPEKLRYSDEYDGIQDVLKGFLPLFEAGEDRGERSDRRALGLKIYMWYDVREGIKTADDSSSVVGLQRVLVLKRLESSPVSFLITLLRLTVLHAHRLQQLGNLCTAVGDRKRARELNAEIEQVLGRQEEKALAKIRSLATGEGSADPRAHFAKSLSAAYASDRPAADPDDPPPQMSLLGDDDESPRREELDRLWTLVDPILRDFETLLQVTPALADIVFGRFERSEWPRRFIAGGEAIDWPTSPAWGQRLVTDAKIRQLVARLVTARRGGQKAVVFSQFSDTIAYIQSVLRACRRFSRPDWQLVIRGLGVAHLRSDELTSLMDVTATITGSTDERDEVVNAFAPYYRIGPYRPASAPGKAGEAGGNGDKRLLDDAWEASWIGALKRPFDVLLSTDVLAEGVNLQDAALLVNFDVHWNPVRMIQRAGRIDRRLNPRIEHGREFADLGTLASRVGRPAPLYYWHDHPGEAPVTVNMILPDELEQELLLRERIATKTLAIDFTLGLEQGTGAEADWMASYKYQGITSLNSLQRDRAIEQIGGHHERLTRALVNLGMRPEWAVDLNGWFRSTSASDGAPLIARALVGRQGGDLERFTRYLQPICKDGVPYWFWAEKRPGESMFDGWLVLDGRRENFPPRPRRDLAYDDSVATPLRASHLLAAAEMLASSPVVGILPAKEIGRPLLQGASALAAPKLGTDEDRQMIAIRDFFILQLPSFVPHSPTN